VIYRLIRLRTLVAATRDFPRDTTIREVTRVARRVSRLDKGAILCMRPSHTDKQITKRIARTFPLLALG
jgi:hypothetical protein